MATAAKKTTTKAPRKAKTATELKIELEKARKRVEELEKRAYAGELEELVTKTHIVEAYKLIKAGAKDATDVAILSAIAKAAGVARIVITLTPAPKRATGTRKKVDAK